MDHHSNRRRDLETQMRLREQITGAGTIQPTCPLQESPEYEMGNFGSALNDLSLRKDILRYTSLFGIMEL